MENRKKIKDELKGLESSLPGESNPGPFSVPEGYFENLAGNILARIQEGPTLSAKDEINSLSPLLASLDRKMPYTVPPGYFEETVEQLPILQDDPRSAILELVERVTPYHVPYDYFDELPSRILGKVKPGGMRVTMKRGWIRMSVAAVLLGIILVSGFWFLDNQKNNNITVAAQLKNVTTQELDEFITNSTLLPAAESSETATAATEVKNLLNDVGDKELEKFLSELPSDDLYGIN